MSRSSERGLVLALAGLAALRVLVSCAVFPFFDNVDEPSHFDLVVKYSRGDVPRGLEHFSREAAALMVRYASDEFLWPPPPSLVASFTPDPLGHWVADTNSESQEPPLYYGLAGAWFALGRALGLSGFAQLYALRALNALPVALLVWVGHRAARAAFPDSRVQRLGVPLLLAVLPQDSFYSIGADVLSPLWFGLGFVGVLALYGERPPARAVAAGTGTALACAGLTKTANLPLIGVAVAALLLRARRGGRERIALALACLAVPLGSWMLWNRVEYGDWTGTATKIVRLGWTPKPLLEWLPHPLFTPAGLYGFWSELAASFWRGEFVWHMSRLAHGGMDVFYWLSSAAFTALALVRLPAEPGQRRAVVLAACSFASGVAFLALLSLGFDFGHSFYPSREHPLFTSGRLLGGALIPFLLLYVRGLDRALAFWPGERARWLALGAVALAITGSEILLDLEPFQSPFNLFHVGG